ncbi:PREDICTED: calvin cycle protein CP12-3, chloroplastic [Tarenaya hassleriana]|uniref:calvin cycle protein CP12-3, chloroplastic n=1 Tax=Tarenaya hassleriana TaxID=28532 RepID=UPI00053C144D|nr:PREDICTED: calvin cycle protein CP12-3, chloroplastic [Tarenaya hassleriana]
MISATAISDGLFLRSQIYSRNLSPISHYGNGFGSETILRLRKGGTRRMRAVTVTEATAKYKGTKMREEKLTEMIERKVKEATEVCAADEGSEECRVAWDEVEEVSQAKADLRLKLQKQDPLEGFCQENPDTDECRIYDD